MKTERIQVLSEYLATLKELHLGGVLMNREIVTATKAIEQEIRGASDKNSNISHHVEHHPLIEWASVNGFPDRVPVVKGTSVTVWDVLHGVSAGNPILDLCSEYDLDINQVTGAIVFAAYVVVDGLY